MLDDLSGSPATTKQTLHRVSERFRDCASPSKVRNARDQAVDKRSLILGIHFPELRDRVYFRSRFWTRNEAGCCCKKYGDWSHSLLREGGQLARTPEAGPPD